MRNPLKDKSYRKELLRFSIIVALFILISDAIDYALFDDQIFNNLPWIIVQMIMAMATSYTILEVIHRVGQKKTG